jgi:intein/homing endonuclease
MTLPVEKQKGLMQGLYFGDGCWNEEKLQSDYATSSKDLANQIMLLLPRFGTCAGINVTRKGGGVADFGRGARSPSLPLYLLRNSNENCKVLLEEVLLERPVESSKPFKASFWVKDGFVWRTVRDLDIKNYVGPVFNLEVEGSHSYLADWYSVHNCDTCSQAILWLRDTYNIDNDGYPKYEEEEHWSQKRKRASTYWSAASS